MKTIFAALASAVLLAAPMASISTPAAAQFHGGGFHAGGGSRAGGFHGGGGFRGASHDGGFRGGHDRGRGGDWFLYGAPFDAPYFYDDPYGYDDAYSYDDGGSACGSWAWDSVHSGYVWVPC